MERVSRSWLKRKTLRMPWFTFHKKLLTAEVYFKLDAESLRDLLSYGLANALMLFVDFNVILPFLSKSANFPKRTTNSTHKTFPQKIPNC